MQLVNVGDEVDGFDKQPAAGNKKKVLFLNKFLWWDLQSV